MAKKLKTGDVKRIPRTDLIFGSDRWVCIGAHGFAPVGRSTRDRARRCRLFEKGERIARILSIGPKYVKVRISK